MYVLIVGGDLCIKIHCLKNMCTLSLTLNFVVLKCSALVDEHPRGYGQEPWLLKCTVAACSGFYL